MFGDVFYYFYPISHQFFFLIGEITGYVLLSPFRAVLIAIESGKKLSSRLRLNAPKNGQI
jgi:hypothetical protein